MRGNFLKRAYRIGLAGGSTWKLQLVRSDNSQLMPVRTHAEDRKRGYHPCDSRLTSGVFKVYFPSIPQEPRVVYPGINILSYESDGDDGEPDIIMVSSYVRL
jgi:hypothetical protein